MNRLDVIQITALTAIVFNAVLTLMVVARDYRSKLHRIYLGWGIAVTLWNLGVYSLSMDISPTWAFFWAKLLQLGIMFIPVIIFHLCMVIGQARTGWLMPALYLLHVGFAVSLYFDKFIIGVRPLEVGYWSVPGPAFFPFSVVYTLIGVYLLVFLYRKQKEAPPMQRKRLRALLAAVIGLAIFGTNDLMPIIGHNTGETQIYYPGTHIQFFPLGSFAAVFYVLIIGYSVLQHRLLDIHVALSRFAAQMVRLVFMMLVGFLLLLVVSESAPTIFTKYSFIAALFVLLASALMASVSTR